MRIDDLNFELDRLGKIHPVKAIITPPPPPRRFHRVRRFELPYALTKDQLVVALVVLILLTLTISYAITRVLGKGKTTAATEEQVETAFREGNYARERANKLNADRIRILKEAAQKKP